MKVNYNIDLELWDAPIYRFFKNTHKFYESHNFFHLKIQYIEKTNRISY